MKRYVNEFANDIFKMPYSDKVKEEVKKIVRATERGLITDFEAVRSLVEIIVEQM